MTQVTGIAQSAIPSPADRAAIAARVRAAGSSFYWAMRLMEPERRSALFAIYAFCRDVDDIADGDGTAVEKRARLAVWRSRIDALLDSRPETALERALAEGHRRFGLDREDFIAVIRGMEMDADGPIVAPSDGVLDAYCDRVASAVGRLCVRVFGVPGDAGKDLADHLGRALQLTNIIRDVEEDAAMGRLYLPESLLARHGIHSRDPAEVAADPALCAVKRSMATRAAREFDAAKAALARCDRGDARPAMVMMAVYERIFARLEARGYRPEPRGPLHRLRAKLEKLWVAALCALKGRRWLKST